MRVSHDAKLATFQAPPGNPQTLLGSEFGPRSSFEADAVQLLVRRGASDDGQDLVQEPIAWPLGGLPRGHAVGPSAIVPNEHHGLVP